MDHLSKLCFPWDLFSFGFFFLNYFIVFGVLYFSLHFFFFDPHMETLLDSYITLCLFVIGFSLIESILNFLCSKVEDETNSFLFFLEDLRLYFDDEDRNLLGVVGVCSNARSEVVGSLSLVFSCSYVFSLDFLGFIACKKGDATFPSLTLEASPMKVSICSSFSLNPSIPCTLSSLYYETFLKSLL